MNIKNFERGFYGQASSCGKVYYKQGRVTEINEYEPNKFSAYVQGSSRYDVNIKLSDNGDITSAVCSCPYALDGSNCKHEAAVLMYIRENLWNKHSRTKKISKTTTSSNAKAYIKSCTEKAVQAAESSVLPQLRIVPFLHIVYNEVKMYVNIGRDRLYSVSSIGELCRNFNYRVYKRYGKNLELEHDSALLDEDSRALLEILDDCCGSYYSSRKEIGLSAKNLRLLLKIYDGKTISYEDINYSVKLEDPVLQLVIDEQQNGYNISFTKKPVLLGIGTGFFILQKTKTIYSCSRSFRENVLPFIEMVLQSQNDVYINSNDIVSFYNVALRPIEKSFDIKGLELLEKYAPPELLCQLHIDSGNSDTVTAELDFVYGDKSYPAFDNRLENPFCNILKETEAEALAAKYFPHKGITQSRTVLIADGDSEIYSLITEGMEELSEKLEVYVTDAFKRIVVRPPATVSVSVRLGTSLLDVDIDAGDYDMQELLEILGAYRRGKKYHRLRNGNFINVSDDSMEELSNMVSALNLSDKDLLKGKLSVPQYRMFYLDSIQKNREDFRLSCSDEFKKKAESFDALSGKSSTFEPPAEVSEIMRDYQKQGFIWLKTIDEYGFGGILADDMGLGKTLQAIALILDEKQTKADFAPAIIVCPSSLTLNWMSEIRKFAPSLKAEAVIGTAAERNVLIENISEYDAVITSYAALVRDAEKYEGRKFGICFIDEAQYIKNHITQASKAVKAIDSRVRFALTGTPIENSLAELWSIFDFLMPGYLYSYSHFKSDYEQPIVKNKDNYAAELMQKITSPFILRRMKKDVLMDLPDKTETILSSELTKEQQKLYKANLLLLKKQLKSSDNLNADGARFQVLAMLTKLRQLCCDPSLAYENYSGGSGKLEQCIELIESSVAEGHKILLFSQFTSMLDIIEQQLKKHRIKYFMLTGKTAAKKRLELVDKFNEDKTKVFLISLKAGGTGLNLTGADVVIHYDPWWNISAENQASDRAYRIGQKNNVQIYKLIAQGTIEEKILELQEAKSKLAELALSSDTDITKMSAADIMELLK